MPFRCEQSRIALATIATGFRRSTLGRPDCTRLWSRATDLFLASDKPKPRHRPRLFCTAIIRKMRGEGARVVLSFRIVGISSQLEADPGSGDKVRRAAQERAAREREARIAAAQERMRELETERARREKTNKQEVARQKEPRASTTDATSHLGRHQRSFWRPQRLRLRWQRLRNRCVQTGDQNPTEPSSAAGSSRVDFTSI